MHTESKQIMKDGSGTCGAGSKCLMSVQLRFGEFSEVMASKQRADG